MAVSVYCAPNDPASATVKENKAKAKKKRRKKKREEKQEAA
jgi:hypothetical protein